MESASSRCRYDHAIVSLSVRVLCNGGADSNKSIALSILPARLNATSVSIYKKGSERACALNAASASLAASASPVARLTRATAWLALTLRLSNSSACWNHDRDGASLAFSTLKGGNED